MKFECKTCDNKKEIYKSTTVHIDGNWVVKEALCESCDKYMEEVLTEDHGMPNLIRTDPTYLQGGTMRPSRSMMAKADKIKNQIPKP